MRLPDPVRVLGIPHAETNADDAAADDGGAARARAPEHGEALAAALGTDADGLAVASTSSAGEAALEDRSRPTDGIDEALDGIEARPDLQTMTPARPTREELRAMLEAAW